MNKQPPQPGEQKVFRSRITLQEYEEFEKLFLLVGRTDNPTQAAIQVGEQRVLQELRRRMVIP